MPFVRIVADFVDVAERFVGEERMAPVAAARKDMRICPGSEREG